MSSRSRKTDIVLNSHVRKSAKRDHTNRLCSFQCPYHVIALLGEWFNNANALTNCSDTHQSKSLITHIHLEIISHTYTGSWNPILMNSLTNSTVKQDIVHSSNTRWIQGTLCHVSAWTIPNLRAHYYSLQCYLCYRCRPKQLFIGSSAVIARPAQTATHSVWRDCCSKLQSRYCRHDCTN